MFRSKQLKSDEKLSNDYIRGLVDGEGCFTFCSVPSKNGLKKQLPAFVISMSERDENLIGLVRDSLGLKNRIYKHKSYPRKDGYKHSPMVTLIVRDLGQLKNIIVPFFLKKLRGYKGKQLIDWIERIDSDPNVPDRYKLIFRLYKNGFYENPPDFLKFD